MRAFILDPSCVSADRSHHLNSILGHIYYLQNAKITPILMANRDCTYQSDDFRIHRAFSYTIYDDVRSGQMKRVRRLLNTFKYARLISVSRAAMQRCFEQHQISANDHIFIPTTDQILLRALQKVLANNKDMPSIHLLLMYEQANWMTSGYRYTWLIDTIKAWMQSAPIKVYTETKIHADRLSKLLDYEVQSCPHPVPRVEKTAKSNSPSILISCPGGGRRDKGYSDLDKIITEFNQRYGGSKQVEFLIQRPRPEDNLAAEESSLAAISNVSLLANQQTEEDYRKMLAGSDIALLPYTDVYAVRGSGIVSEMLANAIPFACYANTSLSEWLHCENGYAANDINDLANSLCKMVEQLQRYQQNADKACQIYHQYMNSNPIINAINTA